MNGYPEDPGTCLLLADSIAVLHLLVVLYVVGGQVLILLGRPCGWSFVHNRWFRASHLALIGFVTLVAGMGDLCPLTVWENELRLAAGQSVEKASFVAYWAHELVAVDVQVTTLRWLYGAFAALVVGSLYWVPVKWRV